MGFNQEILYDIQWIEGKKNSGVFWSNRPAGSTKVLRPPRRLHTTSQPGHWNRPCLPRCWEPGRKNNGKFTGKYAENHGKPLQMKVLIRTSSPNGTSEFLLPVYNQTVTIPNFSSFFRAPDLLTHQPVDFHGLRSPPSCTLCCHTDSRNRSTLGYHPSLTLRKSQRYHPGPVNVRPKGRPASLAHI